MCLLLSKAVIFHSHNLTHVGNLSVFCCHWEGWLIFWGRGKHFCLVTCLIRWCYLSTGPLLFHFYSPTSCLAFFYFNMYLFYVYGVSFLQVCLLPIEARRGHPLELELWWSWASLWVLGFEPGLFRRAASTFNCWAFSLAQSFFGV